MVDQPSFRPQRDPLPLPEGSVPIKAEVLSADSGEKLFSIYCGPCHGASGKADGPVSAKMVKPANLTSAKVIALKDDAIYDVIRNGSGLMPPYAESLSPSERRRIIAHLRKLQKP